MRQQINPWHDRPIEVANLLNPAFCALLMHDASIGYSKQALGGLPYPIAFLILPIVLHQPTRVALPSTTNSLLQSWLHDHSVVHIGFAERIQRLYPYSKEAILFGLQHNLLMIDAAGDIRIPKSIVKTPFSVDSEPGQCRKAANFIGKWFGKVKDSSLVLTMWGMKP